MFLIISEKESYWYSKKTLHIITLLFCDKAVWSVVSHVIHEGLNIDNTTTAVHGFVLADKLLFLKSSSAHKPHPKIIRINMVLIYIWGPSWRCGVSDKIHYFGLTYSTWGCIFCVLTCFVPYLRTCILCLGLPKPIIYFLPGYLMIVFHECLHYLINF